MSDRAEEIFQQVIDLPTHERRGALDEACAADAELRARVDSLLTAHDDAGSFLGGPTLDHVAAYSEPAEKAGSTIDRYKLLELIGHGGFGDVYMAQQLQPMKRRVALKIIKLGMDTKQVVARFEAERQALALMDHPNIAHVLDGGETAAGRPYFVMELVRGDPITEYCDREKLPTTERLKLFQQVCQAIQHAHQKGVIHRDIKPSNVLVTVADAQPLVKVIDFGIAKATNTELTEKTLFTEFRQLIGTPQYMSPEQAERSGVDIDTRSDIYTLGVLLYEMLTGRTPVDVTSIKSAVWEELQRMIREDEPTRPSMLVTALGAKSEAIAKSRGTEPARLGNLLKGDLDWIVLKALEKDRTRRYGAASELSDDVQRYLDDEPVIATPPSTRYKLRKLILRNRTVIAAASALTFVMLIGLVATSITSVWAMRERDNALRAEQESRQASERADRQADRARRMAAMVGNPFRNSSEAETLAKAWLADIEYFKEHGDLSEKDILVQQCQLVAWWFPHGGATEAAHLAEQIYDRAKIVLGSGNRNFAALVNMNIISHRGKYDAKQLADLWDDLIASLRVVQPEEFESMLPQYAGALHRARRDQQATAAIDEYLALRAGSRPTPKTPPVENLRLQASLQELSPWGISHQERYRRLRAIQQQLESQPSGKSMNLFGTNLFKSRQIWEGTLDLGEESQRLRFDVSKTVSGEVLGKVIQLDQENAELELTELNIDGATLTMKFGDGEAQFVGQTNEQNTETIGKWKQQGKEYDLVIKRISAASFQQQ